ncbi:folylpolyglutamate synthase/dihydrofolate synthase family protein [Sphingomonas bacterium]|uniref:bifunctional folylpolyglutamate synthase/dihydrofolate synthase n=1 Tax=Sphingomonas bacterium TaxID=1895847 RepID=UPI002617F45F|nr:folylpolyglutamate synthase/dihydrofolate synthase family protein [Sphingomonas bacterium]MDB5680188.1 bifunctional folylpolyglutamate synthase/dihydrofolate synthase [Sphingomonas bacterium]
MPDHASSTDPSVQRQLDRLWALSPGADILGLERIADLLARIGNPHEHLPPVLHVAGTNGKGSTCAFLRAAIGAAGYKTHVYSSPHLVRFNERIRLAGTLIDDAQLAPLLEEVLDAGGDIGASFFEVTTAVAFLAFSRTPADACIVEVGLGGRLDATNVIAEPIVTGIAQLGIDHERFLGSDIEGIAAEKAGIAKPHVPLVTMRYPAKIEARIASVARTAGAPIAAEGGHWFWSADETHVTYRDAAGRVVTPLPHLAGSHQQANLALAIAMLRHQRVLTIPPEAYVAAAEHATWPARLQRLGPGPLTAKLPGRTVLIDGGHNADAAQAIAASLAGSAPIDMVFGLMSTRKIADVLGPLAPLVRVAHAVPLIGHEHHDPRDIAAFAQAHAMPRHCYPAFSLGEAIDRLAANGEGAPTVLIAGSLYLAGEALAANDELPS